jgi:hypothetical protein
MHGQRLANYFQKRLDLLVIQDLVISVSNYKKLHFECFQYRNQKPFNTQLVHAMHYLKAITPTSRGSSQHLLSRIGYQMLTIQGQVNAALYI